MCEREEAQVKIQGVTIIIDLWVNVSFVPCQCCCSSSFLLSFTDNNWNPKIIIVDIAANPRLLCRNALIHVSLLPLCPTCVYTRQLLCTGNFTSDRTLPT